MISEEISVALGIVAVFVSSASILTYLIDRTRLRVDNLRAARTASRDFYDLAEKLFSDPDTPATLKNMIYDATVAVTYERAGRAVMKSLLRSISEIRHKGRVPTPGDELLLVLNELRAKRPDLYDIFHEALRSAMAAILLANIAEIERSRASLGYDAIAGSQSKLLTLALGIDRTISDWRSQDDKGIRGLAHGECGV